MERVDIKILLILTVIEVSRFSGAIDPVIYLEAASPLKNLYTTQVVSVYVKMKVGSWAKSDVVVNFYAPEKGEMTAASIFDVKIAKTSTNVQYTPLKPEFRSLKQDYLNNNGEMRLTDLELVNKEQEQGNELDLKADLRVVDPKDVQTGEVLWLWASVEVGESYVWVGEESFTMQKRETDKGNVQFKVAASCPIFVVRGHWIQLSVKVQHLLDSTGTAYNINIKHFLSKHLKLKRVVWGSDRKSYSSWSFDQRTNTVHIYMEYLALSADDKYYIEVRGDPDEQLPLGTSKKFNLFLKSVMLYRVKKGGVGPRSDYGMNMNESDLSVNFVSQKTEERGAFAIKALNNRECLVESGGHVTSGANCAQTYFQKNKASLLQLRDNAGSCLSIGNSSSVVSPCNSDNASQQIFLSQDLYIKQSSCEDPRAVTVGNDQRVFLGKPPSRFIFSPELTKGKVLTLHHRTFLVSPDNTLIFICKWRKEWFKRKCYYSENKGKSWTGLSFMIANIVGYRQAQKWLFGKDVNGVSYFRAELHADGRIAFVGPLSPLVSDDLQATNDIDQAQSLGKSLASGWSRNNRGFQYCSSIEVCQTKFDYCM